MFQIKFVDINNIYILCHIEFLSTNTYSLKRSTKFDFSFVSDIESKLHSADISC
jgi:reverse gyrase